MEVSDIYKQFRQQLLGYVRSKIQSKEDAEDIVQNVFVRISLNIDTLSESIKVKNWIFTITRNAIIDYYRANATKKKVAAVEDIHDDILEAPDPDSTQGLDQCIGSMIRLLPDEYRDIIIDSEIHLIKQKDLAEKYGIAYPSMRSRVQRGRERLKKAFLNCCHIETDVRGNVMDVQGKNDCAGSCEPCSAGHD